MLKAAKQGMIKMTSQNTRLEKSNKPTPLLSSLFWALVAIFIIILGVVLAFNLDLPLRDYGKYIFPAVLSVFLLLSIALLVVATLISWITALFFLAVILPEWKNVSTFNVRFWLDPLPNKEDFYEQINFIESI